MLSHDVSGDGPAVLLLHSGVCDRRMWDPQWPVPADAGYRVARCDLRGFGHTPASGRPHNGADDVLDLLGAPGIARAALLGSSYGGRVALGAARRPERVTALALLCSAMPGWLPSAEPPGLLADARHLELPWAGHLPSRERPSEVNDLLLGFLRGQVPAG